MKVVENRRAVNGLLIQSRKWAMVDIILTKEESNLCATSQLSFGEFCLHLTHVAALSASEFMTWNPM